MHAFLWVFRAADLLSNAELLLLKDYTEGCIYSGQKMHLMMLGQGSYGLYSADNIIFRVNNNKARFKVIDILCICLPGASLFCKPLNHFWQR